MILVIQVTEFRTQPICASLKYVKLQRFLFIHLSAQNGIEPNQKETGSYHVARKTPFVDAIVEFHVFGIVAQEGNGRSNDERADDIDERLACADAVPFFEGVAVALQFHFGV